MFVGQEPSLRRLLLDMMTPKWVIPVRKMCARVRITAEEMYEAAWWGITPWKDCMEDYYAGTAIDARAGQVTMAKAPTLAQRLDHAVQSAEERLAAVKESRDILKRNPDLEKLLNIMQKGLF